MPKHRMMTAEGADQLLSALTEKQFLRPHRPLGEVLDEVSLHYEICQMAVGRAVGWLELDRSIAIGRLRRSELSQLAQSLHRFWRQTVRAEAARQRSASAEA